MVKDQVCEFLRSIANPLTEGDEDRSLILFDEWLSTNALKVAAQSILNDHVRTARLAASSQRHQNGFDKLILGEQEQVKLVLHAWKANADEEAEIHNHRWHFVSAVLRGGLVSHEYAIAKSGEPTHCGYKYRSPQGSKNYTMTKTGYAHLRELRRVTRVARSTYFQEADELHRAGQIEANTLTVIVQGAVHRAATDVFSAQDLAPSVRRNVIRLPKEAARHRVADLIEVL